MEFKGIAIKGLAPSVGSCQNRRKTFPSGGAFQTQRASSLQVLLNIEQFISNLVCFKRSIQYEKMQLKTLQKLELPAAADMHVHLRQGEMMDVVVPTLEQGGVDTAFVYVECLEKS